MAKKTIAALACVVMLAWPAFSPALITQEEEPETKPLRFDLTPFIGYRTSISFPIEQAPVTGITPKVVIDQSASYGAAFGVRLRQENDLIEIRWARQDSFVRAKNITPPPARQRVVLDQVHGDFSHEYLVEEWPTWARPFVMASIGATHVSSSTNIDFTRFSFGIGGGFRFYASRHFGFKIQAEWLPLFANPTVAFVCGAGCIIHVGGTLSSQGEVFAGPTLRF